VAGGAQVGVKNSCGLLVDECNESNLDTPSADRRPARTWLVMRDSDIAAAGPLRRREVESGLSGSYVQVGPEIHFRNVTVVLYRVR
jgi:hypothetical protein